MLRRPAPLSSPDGGGNGCVRPPSERGRRATFEKSLGERIIARTALVIGGSIGGLFAAAALRRAGWEARVFERVGVELAGRGAGIVTHGPLLDALRAAGVPTLDLGVTVEERVAFDREGGVAMRLPFPQLVTSWDRIHALLREAMPEGAYRLDRTLTG